jgi:hypothetical protein
MDRIEFGKIACGRQKGMIGGHVLFARARVGQTERGYDARYTFLILDPTTESYGLCDSGIP